MDISRTIRTKSAVPSGTSEEQSYRTSPIYIGAGTGTDALEPVVPKPSALPSRAELRFHHARKPAVKPKATRREWNVPEHLRLPPSDVLEALSHGEPVPEALPERTKQTNLFEVPLLERLKRSAGKR